LVELRTQISLTVSKSLGSRLHPSAFVSLWPEVIFTSLTRWILGAGGGSSSSSNSVFPLFYDPFFVEQFANHPVVELQRKKEIPGAESVNCSYRLPLIIFQVFDWLTHPHG
jgi:hypothetical protein